ncbi:MAG: DUF2162 family putative transporter [Pseudomonadota bacterium]
MELKTLIIGLIVSVAVFAVKAGGGLAYLFLQVPGKRNRTMICVGFVAAYGFVFLAVVLILTKINLSHHIELLQDFFKSGMTLHFLMALLTGGWGVRLLLKNKQIQNTSRGWILLVLPCPVCLSVILLSCSFVSVLYPGRPLVFVSLYAGFILISFVAAVLFAVILKDRVAAGPFLGILMLYIAGYFLLSVIVIPQFADLDKIYRISLIGQGIKITRETIIVIIISLSALAVGLIKPLKRE